MKNKKVIILIVLGIFAIISLIYGITTGPKGRSRRAEIAVGGNFQPASSQAILSTQRRAKRSSFTSWKRNPFVPTGIPGTPSNLVLNGILSSGNNLKAMIGDNIVGKGDKIGNNTVIEIKEDRVILNDGTKDFELKLEK